jgi:metal-dependent amidase/aminoacylase/carboxypeptidase family protein
MRDVDALKARAGQVVDDLREKLVLLSLKLHAEVELAFEEVKASRWITDLLETRGLRVERGLGSLPTAFRATAGSGGPKLAYLCEYDGLPVYGHSCGHNVVAAAGVGAAIALASVIDRLDGTVIALGTPGEEGSGGKYILEREGVFADIDAMMLIYPGCTTSRTLVPLARSWRSSSSSAGPPMPPLVPNSASTRSTRCC